MGVGGSVVLVGGGWLGGGSGRTSVGAWGGEQLAKLMATARTPSVLSARRRGPQIGDLVGEDCEPTYLVRAASVCTVGLRRRFTRAGQPIVELGLSDSEIPTRRTT